MLLEKKQDISFCSYFLRVITVNFCYELKTVHKLFSPVWYSVVPMLLKIKLHYSLLDNSV